jgi:RNA polymerase sigma-70 factor (ECF subfamily)
MDLLALLGHPGSLRRRIEASRTGLYRVAHLWCHDRALADDLTQEALAKALAGSAQLRDPERLRPWLFGILMNCWRDHLRALRPTEDIDAIEEHWLAVEPDVEELASRRQTAARVRSAVQRLPAAQREVLALVDLEEFSYAEAAEILAIPIGTVMSRLSRARASLRGLLEGTVETAAAPALLRRVK